MAIINGRNGNVTVGTGSIIEVGNIKTQNWTFAASTPTVLTTGFAQATNSYASTLPGGVLSVTGLYPASPPESGINGNVSWSNAGATGVSSVQSWTLNIAQPLVPTHGMQSAFQEFVPAGALELSGSFVTLIDNASTGTLGGPESAGQTDGYDLTLTITGAANDNIVMKAMPTGVTYSTDYSTAPSATVNFQHTSASANPTAGAGATLLSNAGAVFAVQSAATTFNALVYDANGDGVTDLTDIAIEPQSAVTGTAGTCWFESGSISCAATGLITVSASFRISGEFGEDWPA